jgi:CRISPR-associated protein Csx16
MRWFVSRHPGALQWMRMQGVDYDCHVAHLNLEHVIAGDTVYGSLPVHLAAEVCARGAAYYHLQLDMPASARGRELCAEELCAMKARLSPFTIQLKR